MADFAVSRYHRRSNFPEDLADSDRVQIFYEQIEGWVLRVAKDLETKVDHQGYALLFLLAVYFEFIAQVQKGASSRGHDAEFFRFGFRSVYFESPLTDAQIETTRCRVRNGSYHAGQPRGAVFLSGDSHDAFVFDSQSNLIVNPHQLLYDVTSHFEQLVDTLRKGQQPGLKCFLTWWHLRQTGKL